MGACSARHYRHVRRARAPRANQSHQPWKRGQGPKRRNTSSRITERVNGRENTEPDPVPWPNLIFSTEGRITRWYLSEANQQSLSAEGLVLELQADLESWQICFPSYATKLSKHMLTHRKYNDWRQQSPQQLSMFLPGGIVLILHKGPHYHLSSCGRSDVASGSLNCPGLLRVPLVPQQAQQQQKDKFPPWVCSILPLWCWDTSCSLEQCSSFEKQQPLRFPFWQVPRKYMKYFLVLLLVKTGSTIWLYLVFPLFSRHFCSCSFRETTFLLPIAANKQLPCEWCESTCFLHTALQSKVWFPWNVDLLDSEKSGGHNHNRSFGATKEEKRLHRLKKEKILPGSYRWPELKHPKPHRK